MLSQLFVPKLFTFTLMNCDWEPGFHSLNVPASSLADLIHDVASLAVPTFRLELRATASKAEELGVVALEFLGRMNFVDQQLFDDSGRDYLGPYRIVLQSPAERRTWREDAKGPGPNGMGESIEMLEYSMVWKRELRNVPIGAATIQDVSSYRTSPGEANEAAERYRKTWITQGSLLRFVNDE